jgi:hypothetical protein
MIVQTSVRAILTATVIAATAAHAAVEISTKPTANMICSGGVCTPTAKKAVLNVNDLAGMLAGGDVTVESTGKNQDIEIDAALSWTSSQALTLDSQRSIAFDAPVVVAGSGALTIVTHDSIQPGDYYFSKRGHVEFWDLNSDLGINRNHYVLVKTIKDLARDIHRDSTGFYALAKSIDTKGHVYGDSPIRDYFYGVFEGLGNTIANLNISSNRTKANVGLFVFLGAGEPPPVTTIRDVGLVNATVAGIGSEQNVGALVGTSQSVITNCYATGTLSANNAASAGGLVGYVDAATIQNSFAAVSVSTMGGGAVGGLVGEIEGFDDKFGFVKNSYASGAVVGGDKASVGGLMGTSLAATVLNSYATGSATGGSTARVGGLVGNILDGADHAFSKISFSYSTGAVSGGSGATIGGLIGFDVADAQNTDDYWNLDTSGVSDPSHGAGNIPNDPGVTGLSDAQLKSGLPDGFDSSIWKQSAGLNGGYPYLIANPPLK